MNWLIIISNIAFGLISASLCVLGWNTLKAIKYLNVGKLFWIPLFLSCFLFTISSIITILNDAFLSLTMAFEIEQITQLIALCSLSVGIFSYSRMIKRNMPENIIPEEILTQESKNMPYSPLTTSFYHKKNASNDFEKSSSSECNHQLGYLTTFPADASFPEECLSCNKIMECKQS